MKIYLRAKAAEILGVTGQTLYHRSRGCGNPEVFNCYSDLSDSDLDSARASKKVILMMLRNGNWTPLAWCSSALCSFVGKYSQS